MEQCLAVFIRVGIAWFAITVMPEHRAICHIGADEVVQELVHVIANLLWSIIDGDRKGSIADTRFIIQNGISIVLVDIL
jgi:hypothetical protein